MARQKKEESKGSGVVTNVSRNPVDLPDGRTIQPGQTFDDVDEASLKDNMFVDAGWLVTGTDAKQLQGQLQQAGADSAEKDAKIAELQDALREQTLRAETAESERDELLAGKAEQ